MKCRIVIVTVLLTTACVGKSAIIEIEFSGQVTEVAQTTCEYCDTPTAPNGFRRCTCAIEDLVFVGDTFTGTLTYDSSALDQYSTSHIGEYNWNAAPNGIHLEIGDLTFRTDPLSVDLWMMVHHGHDGTPVGGPVEPQDGWSVESQNNLPILGGEIQICAIVIIAHGEYGTLTSDALLTTESQLTGWDDMTLSVHGHSNDDRVIFFKANITSISLAPAQPAIRYVPDQYPTIQAAIDDCNDGDVVIVSPGTYTGDGNRDIDFLGKAINVKSQAGPRSCIIDCQGSKDDHHWGVHVYCENSDRAILDGFTITNGYVDGGGGGIICQTSGVVKNCIITKNKAWYGGGISITDGVVMNCVISNNTAFEGKDSYYRNTGGYGGGISASEGYPCFVNCTVVDNRALHSGGGIYCGLRGRTTMENCIIVNNNANQFNQVNAIDWGIIVAAMGLVVRNSCIHSNSCIDISTNDCLAGPMGHSTLQLENNIYTSDVRFVDAEGGDFRLLPDSPCIDTGNNTTAVELPAMDIDGNPRITDGDRDGAAIIDLGAYEVYTSDQPYLMASPSSIMFVKKDNRSEPNAQIVRIYNIGLEQSKWFIQHDCDWLNVAPDNGVTGSNFSNIVVNIVDANLEGGVYTCNISINDANAFNNPLLIPVTLYASRNLAVPGEFSTIQKAIDSANSYDNVVVADGVYCGPGNEEISFRGKRITVRSENGAENCIVGSTENQNPCTFIFENDEDKYSILDGFTLLSWDTSVQCNQSSPMIRNCIITGDVGIGIFLSGGTEVEKCIIKNCNHCGIIADQSNAVISGCVIQKNSCGLSLNPQNIRIENCIISGNGDQTPYSGWIASLGWTGLEITNCTIVGNRWSIWTGGDPYYEINPTEVSNCIFWNNRPYQIYPLIEDNKILYCNVKDGWPGEGNIDADPCFASPGYWDTNETPGDVNDDFWVDGDYHLKSRAGRWDGISKSWVMDNVTSPCIDAGDPASPIGYESFPNGGVINMGAYGGTTEASKTWFGGPVCQTIVAGDVNGDCVVDFLDFAILAAHWLE